MVLQALLKKRCATFRVVKLVMELYHKSLKVVEFMMKCHDGSFRGGEGYGEASPHGFQHPYEPTSTWLHNKV